MRTAAVWAGRLVLLAFAVLAFGPPAEPIADAPLRALTYPLGAAFVAGLLATFAPTRRVGGVGLGVAIWAMFTGYGLVAFLDPSEVIADSRAGSRGPDLDSDLGAYVFGALVLAFVNVPAGLWLWSTTPWAAARRRRRQALPSVEQMLQAGRQEMQRDAVLERRQASRRRRKRRLRRR